MMRRMLKRGVLAWMLALALFAANGAAAQEGPGGWSPAAAIARTEQRIGPGALIADPTGQLHLFFVEQTSNSVEGSINYMRWDGADWSQPVDIILTAPGGTPGTMRAAVDNAGLIHLVWAGPVRSLLYASAPAVIAASAQGWSTPADIAATSAAPDIIAAPDGTLYVAYADADSSGTLALIRSADRGVTWSIPRTIAEVSQVDSAIGEVRIAQDGFGQLHIAWTEYQLPNGWPPIGAFYSRSNDGGETWTAPLQVAGENHGQVGVGTAGANEVHLAWRSTIGGDGSFHQRSGDGGLTWAPPDRADDRGGFSGLPSFATDSLGRTHFVLGPALYAVWADGRLSPYQDIKTHNIPASESGGELALFALTTGNRLHVVYETDFRFLWYTSRLLDVPGLPTVIPEPAATDAIARAPAASETPAVRPTETSAPTIQARPTSAPQPDDSPPAALSTTGTLVVSLAPPVLVVLIVVLASLTHRKRH